MFFEYSNFEFTSTLESNWLLIKQELEQLQQKYFIAWPEKFLYQEGGWDVLGLYAFGRKLEDNCQLCPQTTKIIETIPGITTAGFSSLKPGTHILPHVGYTNAVLRCHLGLIVPDGCQLRVGEQIKSWQEGKCLIFDDTIEHEAWNHADTTRIVLLIDFKRPQNMICNKISVMTEDTTKMIENMQVETYLKFGNQLREVGKIAQAIEKYHQALEIDSSFVPALTELTDIYTKLAIIYENKQDFNRAVAYYYQVIKLVPNDSLIRAKLANVLMAQGDVQAAIATYHQAISHQPKLPVNIYQSLVNALSEHSQFDQVLAIYQSISSLDSTQQMDKELAEIIHCRFGSLIFELSIREGKLEEATSFFRQRSKNQADNPWYYYNLGRVLEIHEQLDEAIACHENALKIDNKFYLACVELIKLWFQKDNWHAAIKYAIKIVQTQSGNGIKAEPSNIIPISLSSYLKIKSWENISNLDCSIPDWKSIKQAFHNAVELIAREEDVDVDKLIFLYSLMGTFLRQHGLFSEAIAYYQKANYYNLKKFKPEFIEHYGDTNQLSPPEFLIIGFNKCGTTALYNYLTQHPLILPTIAKEFHYLAQLIPKRNKNNNYHQNWTLLDSERDCYLSHFPRRPQTEQFITGEASISNVFPGVEKIIFDSFPNIKLTAILRNPVKRVISQYFYWVKQGWETRTLEQVIDSELKLFAGMTNPAKLIEEIAQQQGSFFFLGNYLIHGLYIYYLERWMSLFPKKQFLIINNQDLQEDPLAVMGKVYKFLDLPAHKSIVRSRNNVGYYPKIDPSLITCLEEFYRPHNQRLENFLDTKLNWFDHSVNPKVKDKVA